MRILIAPHEICGQMQLLAEGLRRLGYDATAASYSAPGVFRHSTDMCLQLKPEATPRTRLWQSLKFTLWALRRFQIFHFFAGRSLLPRQLDLPILRRCGKQIVVHFHGSDVRQRKYIWRVVEKRLTDQPIKNPVEPSSERQKRLLAVWQRYAHLTLVSIPELLPVVPGATLYQPAIDLSRWFLVPEETASKPNPLIIAHAASNRECKGTTHVIQAVERLRREGHNVALRLIENVPHDQIASLYASCHIGVDELLQGSYGVISMELMAMGKPVLANLLPWYQQNRPDLPILHADPHSITERLRMLIGDQALRIRLGHLGRQYVQRWHDIDRAVQTLADLYASHFGLPREAARAQAA